MLKAGSLYYLFMSNLPSGRVVSLNVGTVRELVLNGKPQPTGIFKEPVEGRRMLADNAVEGDVQADRRFHGGRYKAVYAYPVEDYAWWETELGASLPPATFGENLTIEGISATDALVGELWRVGGALLEVTQPREPCWKLGAKMGDRHFPRRFREAGRPGAYLKIVEEGDVGAGDAVEIVSRPSHPITLGLLADVRRSDPDLSMLLRRLAKKDVTPEEWAELLGAMN